MEALLEPLHSTDATIQVMSRLFGNVTTMPTVAHFEQMFEAIKAKIDTLPQFQPVATPEPPVPAVSIKKSVHPDYLICLEDGKKLKMLRRHLATLGLTPEQYRTKWGLPADYPMTCENYAKARSELALSTGLGRKPVLRAVS